MQFKVNALYKLMVFDFFSKHEDDKKGTRGRYCTLLHNLKALVIQSPTA